MSVRVRFYVAGELVTEEWLADADTDKADVHSSWCRKLAAQAQANGDVWMYEFYDPDLPAECNHLRWGTDANGMRDPVPLSLGDLNELVRDA